MWRFTPSSLWWWQNIIQTIFLATAKVSFGFQSEKLALHSSYGQERNMSSRGGFKIIRRKWAIENV